MAKEKNFLIALSILIGTCIGAGVLGIPYVASKAGFAIALIYIFVIASVILILNLYLGEITLRTKKKDQLIGYAKKYLGKNGSRLMALAIFLGIYAALIAYMNGIGESVSHLVLGNGDASLIFGLFFGILMSGLLWNGLESLKKFEKWGVLIVLILLASIFIIFVGDISISNLETINFSYVFLPFGVVLFSFISFYSVPEISRVVHKDKKMLKRVLITGTTISAIFYIIFALVVVGYKGASTPEVATVALGPIFIFLGVFTLFTSYLSLGNSLEQNFIFDEKFSRKKAWLFSSIIPIILFILTQLSDYFSFTKILSIGSVFSGGIMAILILLMTKNAKKKGNRIPEYSIPIGWVTIIIFGAIFLVGIIREIWLIIN